MGVEQSAKPCQASFLVFAGNRCLDPKVRGSTGSGVHHRLIVLQLLERGDEARRITRERYPRDVGQRLTPATYRELHELGHDRREDQQRKTDEGEDLAAVVVVVVARTTTATKDRPQTPVRQQRDDTDRRDRERRNQDVGVHEGTEFVV